MTKDNKVFKGQDVYQNLQERYQEMNESVPDLMDDYKRSEGGLRYIGNFIHYKNPGDKFQHFKEPAYEDQDSGFSFPGLIL